MIDKRLSLALEAVAARLSRLRLWRILTLCWLATAVVVITLTGTGWATGWPAGLPRLLVCAAAFASAVWIVWTTRRASLDERRTARQIERRFPELDQRLLAAIEPSGHHRSEQKGFLRKELIDQVLEHSYKNPWPETVPDGELARARLGHLGSVALLLLAMMVCLVPSPAHPNQPAFNWPMSLRGPGARYQVSVAPGDTSIERGSDLLVLARFTGPLPPNVYLAYGATAQSMHRIGLTKSLDDPLFGGRIPEVATDLVYRVEFEDQQTRDFAVTVFDYPRLERVDAEISYPDYTGLPPSRIEDTRRVAAVQGSEVTLICQVNKPVSKAWLSSEDHSTLELNPVSEQPTEYRITVPARRRERYTLHLTDTAGQRNKFPPELVIEGLPNQQPEVAIQFPARDRRVSPLEELSIQLTAWDDFGIESYGIVYAFGASEPETITLGESIPAKEKRQIGHALLLEELQAEPDQLLSYYVWAEDLGPDGKPRRASSDMYFAEVRPFEEIYRQGEAPPGGGSPQAGGGMGREAVKLLELQKQIIAATWKMIRGQLGTDPTAKFTDDVQVIRQSQQQAREQLQRLAERASGKAGHEQIQAVAQDMEAAVKHLSAAAQQRSADPLQPALQSERAAYAGLLKLQAHEHRVVRRRGAQAGGGGGGGNRADRQLQELELDAQENRYEARRTASTQQAQADRENNQVLNRLRELARRQTDLNKRIRELQSALEEAKTEQERNELRRRLKRLRDEQQELLRDLDQLRNRMDRPNNQQRMADARQQLDQTRSNLLRASEALRKGQISQALSAGARAQQDLHQLRDEFRKRSASRFTEEMKDMREQARELATREEQLGRGIEKMNRREHRPLREANQRQELTQQANQQTEQLTRLVEQMRRVSEESETAEPLLSRQLYDTLRKTHQEKLEQRMQLTAELLRRALTPEAERAERQVRTAVENLRKDVERAARSVLGDETEALRRALADLDDLNRQLQEEIDRATGEEPSESQQSPAGRANAQPPQDGKQPQGGETPTPGTGRPSEQPQDDRTPARSPHRLSRQPGNQSPRGGGGNRFLDVSDWVGPGGPLTGPEYREWSDRLRDVEEMLDNPELRAEVAAIRDRARGVRRELTRHSKAPTWSLVRKLIAEPLVELQNRLREELARQEPGEKLVPIDRDPVPEPYAELVRRYYERLGTGK